MAVENRIELGIEYFPDPNVGRPLFNANIYIGIPDLDPEIEANRITVSVIQENGVRVVLLPSAQPLLTNNGGVITYNGDPVVIVTDRSSYSVKATSQLGAQIYYVPEVKATNTTDEWKEPGLAATYIDASRFLLTGDETAEFHTGRRVKLTGGADLYGFITDSVFTTQTTVTVTVDNGGGLNVAMDTAFVGILSANNSSGAVNFHPELGGEVGVTNRTYFYGNVKRYGATGDGFTDDTTAIRNAIASVKALGSSVTSVLQLTSKPEVLFPSSVYVVTSILTDDIDSNITNIVFRGEGSAILKLSAGITAFGGIAGGVRFESIKFIDGASAISIKTNNIDLSSVRMVNCELYNLTGDMIKTDLTSGGGLNFNAYRCKFVIPLGALHYDSRALFAQTGDVFIFEDCQVYAKNNTNPYFYVGVGVKFILRHLFGVPMPDPPGTGAAQLIAWVENHGNFYAEGNCRFGGEGGGAINIIHNYTAADTVNPITSKNISIVDSDVFVRESVIKFFAIPNHVTIRGCNGLVDNNPLWMDSTISSADLAHIGQPSSVFDIKNNSSPQLLSVDTDVAGVSDVIVQGFPLNVNEQTFEISIPLDNSSVKATEQGPTGAFGASTSGTTSVDTTVFDEFGVPAVLYTSTADGQNRTTTLTTFMTGRAAGTYTAAVALYLPTNNPLVVNFTISNSLKQFYLTKGRVVLSIPFYYDGISPDTIAVNVGRMPNGSSFQIERWLLFDGKRIIKDKRVITHDISAQSTGKHLIGDKVINGNRTVDVNNMIIDEFECIVTGSPGTWITKYISTVSPAT